VRPPFEKNIGEVCVYLGQSGAYDPCREWRCFGF
jgi:hypothetical protein